MCLGLSLVPSPGRTASYVYVSTQLLLHPNLVQKLLENDVGDVDEHLLHELRVGGRRLVLVDGVVGLPVLRLEHVPDEHVRVVDTFQVKCVL